MRKNWLLRFWNLETLCLFLCGLCSCVVISWESTAPYWFLKVCYTVRGKTSMCIRVGFQKIPTQTDMWKHLAAQGVRTAHRRCWESKLCKGFCRICSWPSPRCHFYYFQRNLEAMARYFGGQLRNKNTIHRSCLLTVHRSIGFVWLVIFCKALCSCWQQLRRTRPEQNLGWGMLPCKVI